MERPKHSQKSIRLAVHERPLPVRSAAGLGHLLGPTRSSRMISTNSANNSKPPAAEKHINMLHIGTSSSSPTPNPTGAVASDDSAGLLPGEQMLRGSEGASSDLVANKDQQIPGVLFQKLRRRPRRGFNPTGGRAENDPEYWPRSLKSFTPSTCPS